MELEGAVLADVDAYGRCPLADKVRLSLTCRAAHFGRKNAEHLWMVNATPHFLSLIKRSRAWPSCRQPSRTGWAASVP